MRKIPLAVCLFYALAAVFSIGFLHPDEHYSILELISYKWGETPWELFNFDIHLKMRSFFQPFLYYVLLAPFKALGAFDPFWAATELRLFHAGLYILLAHKLFPHVNRELNLSVSRETFWLLLVLWFLPLLVVRTNSEFLSTLFFMAGMLFFLSKRLFVAGLFMGAAFMTRFQMGLPIGMVFLWGLTQKKSRYSDLALYALGIFALIGVGTLIDFWGYGEWTFTPWNYLKENLINDRVSQFGVHPFWFYPKEIAVKGIPPLSLVLMGAYLTFWYQYRKNWLTWATLSFFLLHTVIGHKELRFLTFLYLLTPFILLAYLEKFRQWKKSTHFLIGLNTLALIVVCLWPAHSPLKLYRYLYRSNISQVGVIKTNGRHFEFSMPFYERGEVKEKPIKWSDVENFGGYLLTTEFHQYQKLHSHARCRSVFQIYPSFLYELNFFDWLSRSSVFHLWKCSTSE